jgi:LacI family transcriptional regulator
MVSVRDVAERAGVSPATVSRVLSNSSHPVRDTTREKVLQAAADLNFTPNLLARSLVTKKTKSIGVIVHDIADPYFGEIVRGLEDAAHDAGYQVVACSSDREPHRELTYVETLLAHQVDAVLLAGGGLEDADYTRRLRELLDPYRADGGIVVLLAPRAYRAPGVVSDNRGGARTMTAHLLEFGHARVAFISGPERVRTTGIRLRGYQDALEAAGIAYDPALVASGGFTIDGGRRAVGEVLERCPDVTAMLCANDIMAFGALAGLRARGVDVPGPM